MSVSLFCSENNRNGCEMESAEVAVLNSFIGVQGKAFKKILCSI